MKEEIISPKNEPESSDKPTKRCPEVSYQLKREYKSPVETFSNELQDLEAKINRFTQDLNEKQEKFMQATENCKLTGLNIQIGKLLEFEKECRRRLEGHSLMFNDQRAVNDQQWKKITRIERFLTGEEYREEEFIPAPPENKKKQNKNKKLIFNSWYLDLYLKIIWNYFMHVQYFHKFVTLWVLQTSTA